MLTLFPIKIKQLPKSKIKALQHNVKKDIIYLLINDR